MSAPLSELQLETASVADGGLDGEQTSAEIAGLSPRQLAWRRLRRDKVSFVAFCLVIFFILLAIAAPILESFGVVDPYSLHPELLTGFGETPGPHGGISWSHWFGIVPQTGWDVFARVVLGISFSMMIAGTAVILATVVGLVIGIIAGYMGGKTDFWLGRFMDLLLAFPQTLMLLALSSVLKQRIASILGDDPGSLPVSAVYLILVLSVFGWPSLARIVRGQVLSLRNREFVEAARSLGATRRRIWFKELMPNLWAPVIVFVSLNFPLLIGTEAALSFLGVGIQPPTPSLGNILNDSVSWYIPDPVYFFLPGVVLVLVVLSFNLLGDGLRDALDPKTGR
ncbi:MAG TPA: ABC transporter permease [Jatrophihabitans sp.]|jgi:peptide/nickel transport system permease protein